ncbi:hypothetical protein GCM10011428_02120 [Streptomyces violaceus]|uniref:hypothetical protein n=1 Tax=Streptomyces violaceus TaxID=1936 RepID=UPI0031EB59B6
MRLLRPDRELPGQLRAAVLQRSNNGTGRVDGWVSETVDSGINYAYTQMGNNLSGRVSRALLSCDGHDLTSTGWY